MKANRIFFRTIFYVFIFIFLSGCSKTLPSPSLDFQNRHKVILNQYGKTHFLGFGNATSTTEQLAIKIAKTKALGELADNIKVTILSRLELVSTEITTGDQTQLKALDYEFCNKRRCRLLFHQPMQTRCYQDGLQLHAF